MNCGEFTKKYGECTEMYHHHFAQTLIRFYFSPVQSWSVKYVDLDRALVNNNRFDYKKSKRNWDDRHNK